MSVVLRLKPTLSTVRRIVNENPNTITRGEPRLFTRSGKPASLAGTVLAELGVNESDRKRVARTEANTNVWLLLDKLGLDATDSSVFLLTDLLTLESTGISWANVRTQLKALYR